MCTQIYRLLNSVTNIDVISFVLRSHLVNCIRIELSQTLSQFLSENIDHDSAAGLVLTVLGSAMALLRRCRVNAALTIQLFSQLFHYINVISFNTVRFTYNNYSIGWHLVNICVDRMKYQYNANVY